MIEKIVRACEEFFEDGADTFIDTGVYFGLGILYKTANFLYGYEKIDLRRAISEK